MKRFSNLRPSPALVVALAALVAAMSGAAIALPGKNSVKKNDIANGAVTGKKIAESAIKSKHIKGKSIKGNRLKDKAIKAKQIADDAITSAQVATDGLNSSDIADYEVVGPVRVTATDHADETAGRADSPAVPLLTKGQITLEAKCFRDPTNDLIFGEIYAKTSANGALVDSIHGAQLPANNDELLNTDTPLDGRRLDNVLVNNPDTGGVAGGHFTVTSADGKQLIGQTSIAVKQGNLPGGNGAFGAGNVCLFGLQVSG